MNERYRQNPFVLFVEITVGWFLAILLSSNLHAAISLQDIIENVRQNERLYENIEVRLLDRFTTGGQSQPKIEGVRHIAGWDRELRFVGQDGKFRLEREGDKQYIEGRGRRTRRIRAFDGEQTRLLDQDAVANIVAGRSDDPNFIEPHKLLLRHEDRIARLSTYLQGHKAMAAVSKGTLSPGVTLENTYQGIATFDGLRCHKVWITFISDRQQIARRELWLAEDRNYIPVRQFCWNPRESKDIPNGEGIVSEWREIKSGIWFPMAATYTRYDPFVLQREGKQKLQWRREYTVKEVSLNPHYDIAFFREVKFPDGTAVYEVENDKIMKSYRVGVPKAPGGPTADAKGRWRTSLIIMSGILCIATIALIIRRRKTKRNALA